MNELSKTPVLGVSVLVERTTIETKKIFINKHDLIKNNLMNIKDIVEFIENNKEWIIIKSSLSDFETKEVNTEVVDVKLSAGI